MRARLLGLGFVWKEKLQGGKAHVYTWYQIPIRHHTAFRQGLRHVSQEVDRSLGRVTR